MVAEPGVWKDTYRAFKLMAGFRRFLSAAAVFVWLHVSWAQQGPEWRAYKMSDGLPQTACTAVSVTPQGNVLVNHRRANRISELDGYGVTNHPAPVRSIGRIEASPSGQLWAVAPEGLQELRDGKWLVHRVPQIAAHVRGSESPEVPIQPVRFGRVLFLLPDGLYELNAENIDRPQVQLIREAAQTGLGRFTGMTRSHDDGLWISGARGVARVPGPIRNLKPGDAWDEFVPPESLELVELRSPIESTADRVTLIGKTFTGVSTAVLFDNGTWSRSGVPGVALRFAWRDLNNTLWLMSGDSLFRMDVPDAPQRMPLAAVRQYFDVAVAPGGAFWLATSDGLYRYAPSLWESFDLRGEGVQALGEDTEGRLWCLAENAVWVIERNGIRRFDIPGGTVGREPGRLFGLKQGVMLAQMGERWWQLRLRDGELAWASAPIDASRRILGPARDSSVWVLSGAHQAPAGWELQTYDGVAFRKSELSVTNLGGLGTVNTVLESSRGDLWFGAERGVAWYRDGQWRLFTSSDQTAPEGVECFLELPNQTIWCGAQDRVWAFDGENWLVLRAGIDRVNGILAGRDGSVWIASNSGLLRFWQAAWVENGMEEGLPHATVTAICETRDGRLWAATAQGLSLYQPRADQDAPRTAVQRLSGDQAEVMEGGTLSLLFRGVDKWKSTHPGRLLYSYRLDQHEWSPFQEMNAVSFPDLAAGKHYFQVRAMDRAGNVESVAAQLQFNVVVPWYRETRLVLIAGIGMIVALFFAGLAFNRHRRLLRSYAEVERQVAERSRQLELANRELLQSQKMTALGTLAAGIAHDFNNILSIIKGSAQIIEDNVENPEKIRTRVDRIKTVVEQGSGIVKAMLGFSRESDAQLSVCDPNGTVQETIRLLGDRFLREVSVGFEPAPDLPNVTGSRDLIQQILLNFIFNAAESMHKDKRIVVRTRAIPKLPPGLVLTPAAAAEYVGIDVTDTGCGIPPENLPRIFEPFFTTKSMSTRRGTGLGLSMVYELARRIGAGLAVDSVVNRGSTFTLILPAAAVAAESSAAQPLVLK